MEKVVKLAMVAAALVAGFDAFAAPDKNADAKVEKLADGSERIKIDRNGWGLYFVGNPEKSKETGDVTPVKLSCPNNDFGGRVSGPDLRFPADTPDRWGTFEFEKTGWWLKGPLWEQKREGYSFKKPKNGSDASFGSLWVKKTVDIPAAWKGTMVTMEFGSMTDGAAIVFVNRRRVGYTRGAVDTLIVSPALKYGAPNEVLIFLTCKGWGIPENMKGVVAKQYNPKAGAGALNFDGKAPTLVSGARTRILDVFANTSWRRHTLTVETEVLSEREQKAVLTVVVKDADGNVVHKKNFKENLCAGISHLRPEIPWKDPITWELGRGYLYTMEVTIDGSERKKAVYGPFTFGFREVWVDGKDIYMNGHRQSFRTVYHHHNNSAYGADFLRRIGYNTIHYSHQLQKDPQLDAKYLHTLSEMGMGFIAPAPNILYPEQGTFMKEPARLEAYGMLMMANLRRNRNEPCIVMYYTGVNNCVPNWEQRPDWLAAGSPDRTMDRTKLARRAAKVGHLCNPNVLFFSHGDGNWAGDIASHNLYMNFIPMQEREDFWSAWATHGKIPWQGSEFGQPYERSWDMGPGVPSVPEFLAEYYGDEAIERTAPLQKSVNFIKGYPDYPLEAHPMFWEFTSNLVWRVNRAYRADGGQGGLVWFYLKGFGNWGDRVYEDFLYYHPKETDMGRPLHQFKDFVQGEPRWLWPSYYVYQLGNHDFLGYIGGWPRHTNPVHDYFPGDRVERQIVMMWDRYDERTFSCEWTAALGGGRIAGGTVRRRLECNVVAGEKIGFDAPEVAERTSGTISAVFRDDAGREVFRDEIPFEVTPRPVKIPEGTFPAFAVLDPTNSLPSWLDDLGVTGYRRISSFEDLKDGDEYLIVGRSALEETTMSLSPDRIRRGLKVMFLFQPKAFLDDMGFNSEGRQSRDLFVRDFCSPALASLSQTDLHHWRGCPMLGVGNRWGEDHEYGGLGGEGPKWLRDYALACLLPRTPNIVGFRPEIAGAFNLEYSALMSFFDGSGKVVYCAFQFEDRMKDDPGARRTAEAVLRQFFLEREEPADRPVVALGDEAAKLLGMIGYPGAKALSGAGDIPERAIVVAGSDANVQAKDLAGAIRKGADVLCYRNEGLEAGFGVKRAGKALTPADVEAWMANDPVLKDRGELARLLSREWCESDFFKKLPYSVEPSPKDPLTRAIGREILHWQDWQEIAKYEMPEKGRLALGGYVAVIETKAGGSIVCAQFDPVQSLKRFVNKSADGQKWVRGLNRPDRIRVPTIYARLLTNMGAAPDPRALARQLVYKKSENCVRPANFEELMSYSGYYTPGEGFGNIYIFRYW